MIRGLLTVPPSRRLFATAALAALIAVSGCSKPKGPPAPPPAEVGVVTLAAESVGVVNELTGRTAATLVSEVRPQVNGLIKARLFKEGQLVRAGQPLYQIDPRTYQASLQQAVAQLASAQATLVTNQAKADRYRSITDKDAVARQTVDDAIAAAGESRAGVQENRAGVASARVNLEYTRVLSPISGRIGRSSVTPGALVTADQTTALATIQQLDPIYVDVTQSSAGLLRLRQALAKGSVLPASATVRLKLEDGTDYARAGVLEFSEVEVDEATGAVTLRARFPNPDGLLLPHMFVRVEVAEGVTPNAILAPQQGITRDAKGGATALVVDAQNKVVMKTVTAARAIGDKWLITQGLSPGDRLIVEGTDKAQPGSTVKPTVVKLGG